MDTSPRSLPNRVATATSLVLLAAAPALGGALGCLSEGQPPANTKPGDSAVSAAQHALTPGWTPQMLDSSTQAYFTATAGVTTDPNNPTSVTKWTDQLHGTVLQQTFVPGMPKYQSSGTGTGLPTITFSGGQLLATSPTTWSGVPTGTEPGYTILTVMRSAAPQSASLAAWWDPNGQGYAWAGLKQVGSLTYVDSWRVYSNAPGQAFATAQDIGTTVHVVAWRYDPGTALITEVVDGVPSASTAMPAIGPLPAMPLIVGARSTLPTGLFQGDISELRIVNRPLSDTEIQNYTEYERSQWHITTAAPNANPCLSAYNATSTIPSTTRCDDLNPQTYDDHCSAGACVGTVPGSGSPAALSPVAWYHANPQEFVVTDGGVSTWFDRSQYHRDLMQPFYYGRPTIGTWPGGKASLHFSAGQGMRRDAWTGAPLGVSQPFTILAVFESGSAGQNSSIASWWNSSYSRVSASLTPSGDDSVPTLVREGEGGGTQSLTDPVALGSGPHTVVWRYTPDSLTVTLDGQALPPRSYAALDGISAPVFLVGMQTYLPTGLFTGDLAELAVVGRSITDAEVDAFDRYVAVEWGGPLATQVQTWIDNRFYATSDILASYITSTGDQVDCIDFYAQHSVKAWQSVGVTIPTVAPQPMPPASTPGPNPSALATEANTVDVNGHVRHCPSGAVAVMRPTVATIEAMGGLTAYKQKVNQPGRRLMGSQHPVEHDCWVSTDKGSGSAPGDGSVDWEHASGIQTTGWQPTGAQGFNGMQVTVPVYTPSVQVASDHTDTQLWAQTGQCEYWYGTYNCITGAACTNCNAASCDPRCAVQSLEMALMTELEPVCQLPGGALTATPEYPDQCKHDGGTPLSPAPLTRLHVFFTVDGYKTSCFVGEGGSCPGCPHVSSDPDDSDATDCLINLPGAQPINRVIPPQGGVAAQYGNAPSELVLKVFNSAGGSSGYPPGWWLYVDNGAGPVPLGFLPPQAFNWDATTPGPMSKGPATYLQAGGEVMNSWPGGFHTDTAMVSDNAAQAGYKWAAYQRNVTYFDQTMASHPATLQYVGAPDTPETELDDNYAGLCGYQSGEWIDAGGARGAYSIATGGTVPAGGSNWGTYFYFGGGPLKSERCPKSPGTPGVVTEFTLAPNSNPRGIVAGTDCNVWYVVQNQSIVRMDPNGQVAGTFNTGGVSITFADTGVLTPGPDGNMWATGMNGTTPYVFKINGMFGTSMADYSGVVHANPITSLILGPPATGAPDGLLWLAGDHSIASVVLGGSLEESAQITERVRGVDPFAMTAGPNGTIWFTTGAGKQIGHVGTDGTGPVMINVPDVATYLTATPDGSIWFDQPNDVVMKIAADGTTHTFFYPPGIGLGALTAGPDGNAWIVENVSNKIARLSPNGIFDEYLLSTQTPPAGNELSITAGPDGNLWVAETTRNKIARMTPP